MRDPQRIDGVLAAVRDLWIRYPDWRLCQLIHNVTGKYDAFYVEDETVLEQLQAWKPKP